jgi:hypothetical protein
MPDTEPKVLKIRRLDDTPSGDCPLCGQKEAYPWFVEGYDGYVDACGDHARKVAVDSIAVGWLEKVQS